MSQKFVVVDLETTGNAPKRGDRIIQLSAVVMQDDVILEQFTSFVNPLHPIPPFITELTGIDDQMVKDAPLFEEIAEKVSSLLEGAVFTAHNVSFDLGFLQNELEEAGYAPFIGPSLDTVELSKVVYPTADSYKLTELSEGFSLSHDQPHRADSDAYATALLLNRLTAKLRDLPIVTLESLLNLSYHLKSDVSKVINEIIGEKRHHIENLPPHLEVFRGMALLKKNSSQLPDVSGSIAYPKVESEKEELLSNVNPLFEKRSGQFQMMDAIMESFLEERHAVIEAGTGIGKSIAYLMPCIFFSLQTNNKVVISTYTNQLQDQLMNKEITALEKGYGSSFRTALLKGRSHYIHLLKFEYSLKEQEYQYDSVLSKMQMLVWLTETETGDLEELNLTSGGRLFSNRIKHDGWYMSKEKDPWIERDFYLHARKRADDANIIITNHSMLMSDAMNQNDLLPQYDFLVIDEAHHLEKAAKNHSGISLDYIGLKFLIGQLGTSERKQLFSKLESVLQKLSISPAVHAFEIDHHLSNLDQDLDDLFSVLSQIVSKKDKSRQHMQKVTIRMNEELSKQRIWQSAVHCAERVRSELKHIRVELEKRLQLLSSEEKKLSTEEKAFLEEMHSFLLEWAAMEDNLVKIIIRPSTEIVAWMEADLKSIPNSILLSGKPVSLQKPLNERLFTQKKSIVMTSASLSVDGSFDYFMNEIGLEEQGVLKLQLSSPFQFEKMAKLVVPRDIPDIKTVPMQHYIDAISNYIIGLAQATKGRMLILFTSYDMLKRTYNLIKDSGILEDFILMAQGISGGSRTRLTKNFQKFDKAILFGTNSFWEGVDIPGEDLSCLVIVRLPFSPPDEPLVQAKNEQLKSNGVNPFTASALPEAILRFKQGFGRLIRGNEDRGIVIVFDRRIVTTSYGKSFISSIPRIPLIQAELDEITDLIEEWL
ncbi:ATP-dependent DNA helicase DinG [Falsibacillus pallidus]|uniref:3'-5' exonuclease DinG n=1 Tax=Falsibacillus pallidus TaxID=493781 RepID=A0A370GI36_9BACI|nr:ATP-dependent DNA helicase DinG [Falsibacillus pallidus]RDI43020.1 ATP-dependent DNA helicase DinG [Falsibacillus pallidus]